MTSEQVFIVAAKRTATGAFGKSLSALSATDLGATAIKAAFESVSPALDPELVDEVFFGNVLSAGLGQNPARQAALKSGVLPNSVPCTTINKVCASGMKAAILGAQAIVSGSAHVIVVGGMESMSNTPYYLPKQRFGSNMMGNLADDTAKELSVTREEQDDFAVQSYQKSQKAAKEGAFSDEIVEISLKQRGKPDLIFSTDEEITNCDEKKIRALRPAFNSDGTVTAANASTLSDGASALILVSGTKVSELGLRPIAKIIGWGDAAREPARFTLAPSLAIPRALKHAGLSGPQDVDFWEINEAFSVVSIANARIVGIPMEKLNVFGGGVSQGHPLGSSGSRIMVTLTSVLNKRGGDIGVAAVCNGAGGASSIVIKRV